MLRLFLSGLFLVWGVGCQQNSSDETETETAFSGTTETSTETNTSTSETTVTTEPQDTSEDFAVLPEVVFSPGGGTFISSVEVELSTIEGATVYFAFDGDAMGQYQEYKAPIEVPASATILAYAVSDIGISKIQTSTYIEVMADLETFESTIPLLVLQSDFREPNDTGDDRTLFNMVLIDTTDGVVSLLSEASVTSRAGLKVRGSSSSDHPKRPYSLELWEPIGDSDLDKELLGMPSESDWVLYAPLVYDRALMRNSFIYQLSRDIGRYAARTRFVEVFVADDGDPVSSSDYIGVYALIEELKRGEDRINVTNLTVSDLDEPEISGGYIFKEDRTGDDEGGFTAGTANEFSFQQSFVNVDPKEENIESEQHAYLVGYLNNMAFALAQPDFTHPGTGQHYSEWLDVDAFIDHHILNILTKNPDGLRLSGYFHKDRDQTLHAGPIWDFDRTMGCDSDDRASDPTWWDPSNYTSDTTYYFSHGWYKGLFDDPDFRDAYWTRFETLLGAEMSVKNMHAIVDEMAAEIAVPAERNFEKWSDYPPRGGSFQAEVDTLKLWLQRRHSWISVCLDDMGGDDPQYCTGNANSNLVRGRFWWFLK